MSKKDYKRIAEAFAKEWKLTKCADESSGAVFQRFMFDRLVYRVASVLMRDNPKFDLEKFKSACKGVE